MKVPLLYSWHPYLLLIAGMHAFISVMYIYSLCYNEIFLVGWMIGTEKFHCCIIQFTFLCSLLIAGISLLGQPVTQASTQSLGTSSMFSLGTTSNNNNNTLNNTLFNLNNTANASLNVSAATKQPFTLQKPPQGAKRGKR